MSEPRHDFSLDQFTQDDSVRSSAFTSRLKEEWRRH